MITCKRCGVSFSTEASDHEKEKDEIFYSEEDGVRLAKYRCPVCGEKIISAVEPGDR